jgi:hypothetical protein
LPSLVFGALAGEGDYLFDAMKKPSYRKAWTGLIRSERNLPSWFGQITGKGNYVAAPTTSVSVEGVTYQVYFACKAHDCGANKIEVMFAPDGTQAWGALIDQDAPVRYLGNPSPAQAKALQAAIKN